jgi:hypothetical protein
MPTRYGDSFISGILCAAAPAVITQVLWSTWPAYRSWSNTWPGAWITAGLYAVVLGTAYYKLGDDLDLIAADDARWASRLPSCLMPIVVSTSTDPSLAGTRQFRPWLGADVDALESGELDLPDRLFNYSGSPYTSILSLRSRDFLSASDEAPRAKLETLLRVEGMTETIGRIWLLTPPRVLGAGVGEHINLWYIYDLESRLAAVVLERCHARGKA